MEKRTVVIWIKSSQKEALSPFYHKGASYNQFAQTLSERHHLFFAYDSSSFQGDQLFYPVGRYIGGEIMEWREPVRADVIYNLGNIPVEDLAGAAAITNTPSFKKFCNSKFEVYTYLHEFSPKTFFVNNESKFFEALALLETDMVVFKPNTGTNGEGVKIFKKNEAMQELTAETRGHLAKGALLQEFVDTKSGIPGICESYHDLRLVIINDTIALTHVRIPQPGSLIANHQQGADIHELRVEQLPQSVLDFHKKLHVKIAERFPKAMYTMDIGITAAGVPMLFEINGTTAFPWPTFATKELFIEHLIAHLESVMK